MINQIIGNIRKVIEDNIDEDIDVIDNTYVINLKDGHIMLGLSEDGSTISITSSGKRIVVVEDASIDSMELLGGGIIDEESN